MSGPRSQDDWALVSTDRGCKRPETMGDSKPNAAYGTVYLVGAGPGAPDLITVRGQGLLAAADVVLYDALSHPGLLALARPGAELRNVGKRGGSSSPSQAWITTQLIELARAGKQVVRLKGGDSFLFARGAEEAEALVAEGIPFEVVPGLSSPIGTSAYAGIPLTHRELSSSVSFITGTDREGKEWSEDAWLKIATATDTLCILMGMRRIGEICRALIRGGRAPETPAAVIMWGARPQQRVCEEPLESLAERAAAMGLTNPAVIVVGEVVALREKLSWFERKPLFGRRILVPRPVHQARETASQIRERGADAVVFPVIEIHPPPEPQRLLDAVSLVGSYDWLLFTSANGVNAFFGALTSAGGDSRRLANVRVGAIGPRTASALGAYGIRADLVAEEFVGEGLARAVIAQGGKGKVLLPRALEARDELPRALRGAGMTVDVVPAYETKPIDATQSDSLRAMFERGEVDTVMFTSSSMVSSTVQALGTNAASILARAHVASIGPITTKTATDLGLRVDSVATEYTVSGLLDSLPPKDDVHLRPQAVGVGPA
jgi:uroporphyrinogen III methyltransferase / synthase